jgi:nucleotide-binding universal stress UspA family protein
MTTRGERPPVIAGWSGSSVSERVLETAAGFAERSGVQLRVVVGWDFLEQPGAEWDPHVTAEAIQGRLDEAAAAVRTQHPRLVVVGETRMGWPPTIVAEAAREASMLVIGRSAKTEGHFGSWSPEALVRHVHCPIVFVP